MAFVSHCCRCATNHSDKMLIFKNGTWMIQSPYELEDSFTAYMFVTSAAIRPYELDTKSWQVSIRGKRREQIITVSTSRVQYESSLRPPREPRPRQRRSSQSRAPSRTVVKWAICGISLARGFASPSGGTSTGQCIRHALGDSNPTSS